MLDELRAVMNEAHSRAARLDKTSAELAELERKRNTCLFELFGQVRDIVVGLRQVPGRDRRKLLGDEYGLLCPQKVIVDMVLQKVAPGLDAKRRVKYAAVVRLLLDKMPAKEDVKAFVRENDGINGCVAREKKLRMRRKRATAKH